MNGSLDQFRLSACSNRAWAWLLLLGVIFIVFGCVGLSMVVGLTLVSMVFFGILLIVAGVSQIIDAFKSRQWQGVFWHALVAFLYVGLGALIIYDPFLASTLITVLLAWIFIIIGAARIFMAFSLRHGVGWVWLLLAGIAALIIGVLILMQWPLSGLWVIGLFIAIDMLMTGWSYIFMALALRSNT